MANNVTTHHYDNARTGWNQNETLLTPATVNNLNNFGYLFQQSVDDIVFAQPLYLEGLQINGAAHNVVFVCTEAGTIYAFDADRFNQGEALWKKSLPSAAVGGRSPRA